MRDDARRSVTGTSRKTQKIDAQKVRADALCVTRPLLVPKFLERFPDSHRIACEAVLMKRSMERKTYTHDNWCPVGLHRFLLGTQQHGTGG